MFEKTRITLTAWYVLILMIVSISFSIFLYINISRGLDRALRMQKFRIEHPEFQLRITQDNRLQLSPVAADIDVIDESKQRLLATLIFVNGILLIFSSLGGYFLAGRTLRPIQDALEEQKRFVADASHELKTPLTSLRSEIEVGLRDKTISLPAAKSLLESNLEEVIALQVLTDNLLTLAQHKEANVVLNEVLLSDVVRQAIKMTASFAKTKHISIENKVLDVKVMGVQDRLMQVVIILLDNAIKYSNTKSTVVISSRIDDGFVSLEVTDQGIGIAKEDLKHVFDRFYRVSKSRSKNEVPGYGLGLSIAKQIIISLGGTINIESELSKGTIVTVKLRKS